ncbi:MAG: PhzF family phenazine biosynthesis protein [Ornithinimicrobium sp.]
MPKHLFSQVDVFSDLPMLGNPVAVVHDALAEDGSDVDSDIMQAVARWTNLSETTFVLPPHDAAADYRLRIFTPGGELPFAGHPTLGSCRAWLAVGGVPRDDQMIVQECEAGLVRIRRDGERLSFAAPPLIRFGPPEDELRARVIAALGVGEESVLDMSWVVNGPPWLGVLLDDAQAVLDLVPDFAAISALGEVEVGVVGAYPVGDGPDFEVRAFCPGFGMDEDPVTGSLQAGLAQWLIGSGVAPRSYVAAQGTVLGRAGRVSIEAEAVDAHAASRPAEIKDIWVGGEAVLRVAGAIDLS